MDKIKLAVYTMGLRDDLSKTVIAIASHAVMDKITWVEMQKNRAAEVEHAEVAVAVMSDVYSDGMTTQEMRRALSAVNPACWTEKMRRYYLLGMDCINAELDYYCNAAEAGDLAARHIFVALRKRHIWARVCKAADPYNASNFSDIRDVLDALYAEGQFVASHS